MARRHAVSSADTLLTLTFFLLPWIGVGLFQVLLGRTLSTGVQPALLSGGLALLCLPFSGWRGLDEEAERWLALLLWIVLGTAALWQLQDMGLQGEMPWLKALKQCVQLVYFFALALLPSVLLARSQDRPRTLARWERAASLGLLLASLVGLYLAVAFYAELPGEHRLLSILSSNRSIASGSDELYLGHSFVGIPRVRSGAAEPLYFGSYLLCVLPMTAVALVRARGWSRLWRALTLLLGLACLLLTFSRGVYLGLVLLLCLLGLGMARGLLPRPSKRVGIPVAISLVVGTFALSAFFTGQGIFALPRLLVARMEQSFARHDLSNLTRLSSWRAALSLFAQHPFFGVGWSGFGFWFYRVLGNSGSTAVFGWPVTNSFPLRVLAETGLVGAVLWGSVLMRPLSPLRALLGGRRAGVSAASFVLASCMAAMLLQMLTFSQMNLPHLWLTGGVAAALVRWDGGA
jgi:O-antigen ligase